MTTDSELSGTPIDQQIEGEEQKAKPIDPQKQIARLISSLEKSRFNLAFASNVGRHLAELASEKITHLPNAR